MDETTKASIEGDFLYYETPDGKLRIQAVYEDETMWLSQKKLAELYDVEVPTINYHLKEIFQSGELTEDSTIRKFRIVQIEGSRQVAREIEHYNLDAIIAVGYRVNSYQATRFRIWATQTLKEFLIKGFVLDDERLKKGQKFGKDYFEELLERVREIRASERRFYQKITDIFQECSIDYDANAPITRTFFATVQNKLHWAITKHTAAELIKKRANAGKPNMGLQTWKNAPKGKILKSDTSVAKNYLEPDELQQLNRIVSMYLDYAELQAEKQIPMKMQDWVVKLDAFLQFNEYELLTHAGMVSAEIAKAFAESEYQKFRVLQDRTHESDFDKEIKKLKSAAVHKRERKKKNEKLSTESKLDETENKK